MSQDEIKKGTSYGLMKVVCWTTGSVFDLVWDCKKSFKPKAISTSSQPINWDATSYVISTQIKQAQIINYKGF